MSKIYKALEKAEREREKELKKDLSFIAEAREERKREAQEKMPDLPRVVGRISDQGLVSLFQPGSLASEQFRKLRTYLFRNKTSEPARTIMITSSTSGEGKTFIAANLAVGIANDFHAHALVVDCDLRNPTLPQLFDLENDPAELDDLAPLPAHEAELRRWRQRLVAHLAERGDEWVKGGRLVPRPRSIPHSPNYPGCSCHPPAGKPDPKRG